MSIKLFFRQIIQAIASNFQAKPNWESFLCELLCELTRRNFSVERYEDEKDLGLKGEMDIYPSVIVRIRFCRGSSQAAGCLCFAESNYYDLVARDERLQKKMKERYFSLSDNPAEIARELCTDALLLGVALDVIHERLKIEARLNKS